MKQIFRMVQPVRNKKQMMRLLLLCSLLYCAGFCRAQSAKSDTVFLLKEVSKNGDRHVIYIAPAGTSSYHSKIANFGFGRFDSTNYVESMEWLKAPRRRLKPLPADLPRNWCPLYVYKGQYCLVTPTDFGYNLGCLRLSDSTLITYGGEGATAARVMSFEPTAKNCYKLCVNHTDTSTYNMDIFLVDRERGLAVFGNRLMVSGDKAQLYPVIVDDSDVKMVYPEGEYPVKFDDPNIIALIKKARR